MAPVDGAFPRVRCDRPNREPELPIAAEAGLHRRYVGRVIQMAFLAPDITEAILEGRQPPHLTLEALMNELPGDWGRQRKQLLASSKHYCARVPTSQDLLQ